MFSLHDIYVKKTLANLIKMGIQHYNCTKRRVILTLGDLFLGVSHGRLGRVAGVYSSMNQQNQTGRIIKQCSELCSPAPDYAFLACVIPDTYLTSCLNLFCHRFVVCSRLLTHFKCSTTFKYTGQQMFTEFFFNPFIHPLS